MTEFSSKNIKLTIDPLEHKTISSLVLGGVERADETGFIRVVKGEAGGDVFADGGEGAGNAGYTRAQALHGWHAEAFVVGEVDGTAAVALHELLQLLKGQSPVLHPVWAR